MFGWLKRIFLRTTAPAALAIETPEPEETTRKHMRVSPMALIEAKSSYGNALNPWQAPRAPYWLEPAMAMDYAAPSVGEMYAWAAQGAFSEGLGFLGYAYLSELAQRAEYRRMVEIIASQMTRKWIKLRGPDKDRLAKIEAEMERFNIKALFREAMEHDGFFGRGQIFVDLGHRANDTELAKPLLRTPGKIGVGKIKGFRTIEPFWSYPGNYDANNPLSEDFYRPQWWTVMSARVDRTRLINFVSREVPDILKPAYQFGGLALTQMAKPYVDNWLRTRQSVSDLVHTFSTMVLSTDMGNTLSGGRADTLVNRAKLFNQMRDNRGLMMIDKDNEELTNVTTPLSGLKDLQAQSQEQMSSVSGIPLVIYLGVTPSGLNASSAGEIQTFYDNMLALEERVFRDPLKDILVLLQLNLDGVVDDKITFEFEPLEEEDETQAATNRKSDADVDTAYVDRGIVSPDEVRARISGDERSPYHGLDLASTPAPTVEKEDDDTQAQDYSAIHAAGVLFMTPAGRALFLLRAPTAETAPDMWALPGGTMEPGESMEDAARREVQEEIGQWVSDLGDPIDIRAGFATFLQVVDEEFTPTLNDEHVAFAWGPLHLPPLPVHPNLADAINS